MNGVSFYIAWIQGKTFYSIIAWKETVFEHSCMYVHTHPYIRIHIHIYIHTYTNTYTRACKYAHTYIYK